MIERKILYLLLVSLEVLCFLKRKIKQMKWNKLRARKKTRFSAKCQQAYKEIVAFFTAYTYTKFYDEIATN
ncbi:hypothetical protein BpHYR1_006570 [Brachionus plicatilis]|uniref:Uncharacterized protein n=1 Tax=Brachionus plicatilis TaxID=10195 RepID=A0A3M7QCB4_BRAPC|nr:hypothetical protein BpHYR1_006570 [Brachionus plicatilis]